MSSHFLIPQRRKRGSPRAVARRITNSVASRTISGLTSEFNRLKPDVLVNRVEFEGLGPVLLGDDVNEVFRAVALSVCLSKEEILVRDICSASTAGRVSVELVNETARHYTDHLSKALRACGRENFEIRLSRSGERFDLRVYLGSCRSSRLAVEASETE